MSSDKAYAVEQRLNALVALQPQYEAGAGQTVNSVTPAAVTGCTLTLADGTYRISGSVMYAPNQSAGSAVLQWGGSASFSSFRVNFVEVTLSAVSGTSQAAGFGNSASTNFANTWQSSTFGAAARWVIFDGAVVVSAPGTLILQASCTTASDTYAIQFGTGITATPSP